MNYKKIIKSRSLRLAILRALAFIPDKMMVEIQYRIKTGRKLDLKNPRRFTEKLQWYKLYYKNPLMIQCVDKYEVRKYVESKGLSEIMVPCYGVFDCVEEIDWDILPNQFVLKDTLGGGGNSVVIIKDKHKENIDDLKQRIKAWINVNAHIRDGGREWPYYSGKKHRILAEQYIESDESEGGLIDYKFFCFNGNSEYLYVIADRDLGINTGLGVYNRNFDHLNVQRADEHPLQRIINKPENFDEMLRVAEILSRDFPEARVDLYNKDGHIFFGEITFYDGSGYMSFKPDEFDLKLGNLFALPNQ